jgi:peptide chain release factor 1
MLDMYIKYGQLKKFEHEIVFHENGKATIKFEGFKVWEAFQYESGKHVVQRCPPTENKGRRHTSTISVAVLPLFQANSINIEDKDLEVTTQRGHGPGGQHQNKTDSAVRMRHIPTGITVFINGRKQAQNKKTAYEILNAKVNQRFNSRSLQNYNKNRKQQLDGGNRSNKVRTYNFINNRVVDHRLGVKTSQIKKIMNGQLDELFKTVS